MKTISEINEALQSRMERIDDGTDLGITYTRYEPILVDREEAEIVIFEHENGYVEVECGAFWSTPITINSTGNISWSSGPATVGGTPTEIANVMSWLFELTTEYTTD